MKLASGALLSAGLIRKKDGDVHIAYPPYIASGLRAEKVNDFYCLASEKLSKMI
jgi:hypothetical protein